VTAELPSDVWSIILNNLTNNEDEKDYQFIALSFISQVSKYTNLICKKLKQQLDIATKAKPAKFQEYFASKGYLSCLKYAHEYGCPWNKSTCSSAAENGNLEVLKYARENGCPWNEWTCSEAASGGHLEVLKYARENGCPWNRKVCAEAAYGGHLEGAKGAKGLSFSGKVAGQIYQVVPCIMHKEDPSPTSWEFHPMPQTANYEVT
jgi:hypothetical protein